MLTVKGSLTLDDVRVVKFDDNLCIDGNFNIKNSPDFEMPKGYHVGGEVVIDSETPGIENPEEYPEHRSPDSLYMSLKDEGKTKEEIGIEDKESVGENRPIEDDRENNDELNEDYKDLNDDEVGDDD